MFFNIFLSYIKYAENPQNTHKKNTQNTCKIHIKIHAIYFHRDGASERILTRNIKLTTEEALASGGDLLTGSRKQAEGRIPTSQSCNREDSEV